MTPPDRRLVLSTLALLLLLAALPAAAEGRPAPGEAPSGKGGGPFVIDEAGPHVSAELRARIETMIRDNVRRLESEGRLPARQIEAVPLDWPLARWNGFVDNGYHGISNFVDQDPASGQVLDYECGPRSYDTSDGYNHQGVDFFTWPFGWLKMDSNHVAIVAAAAGTIVGKDDGNPDRSCACEQPNWNAVYVMHADGSTVWYGHMKNGSQTSKGVGENVAAGEFLGIVGSSGCSTGPHLHMELYDPSYVLQEAYLGPCNVMNPGTTWWRSQRPYYDSAVNHIGTGAAAPQFPACPGAESPNESMSFPRGSRIYFSAYYRDQLQGQVSVYTIRRPDGSVEASWSDSSPAPHYAASYWYWYLDDVAASGPDGQWVFQVEYEGSIQAIGFTIGDPSCSISPSALPPGSVGVAYSQTFTASGGTPPTTFTSTTPPPGLTLTSGGLLSGTPLVAGSFTFAVTATNNGCSIARSYVLDVAESGNPDELLVGRGLGQPNPNQVRGFFPDGFQTGTDFLAFGAGQWGVNVSSGRLDATSGDEILAAPGPGAVFGPQVRAFLPDGSIMGKVNFYAYGTLRYGANTGGADLDGDAFEEIVTGPGPGDVFGPHVRAFNVDAGSVAPIAKVNFFAYGTLKYGVNDGGGDLDADGFAEMVTGPGPGAIFGPQVRGFDYDGVAVSAIAKVNFNAFSTSQYGVNVAAGDVEGDVFHELFATPGPGPGAGFPSRFGGFDYDGAAVAPLFDVTLFTTLYGGRVGAGDVTGELAADLLPSPGRDPAAPSYVFPHVWSGGALAPLVSFEAFPGAAYGANPASGDF